MNSKIVVTGHGTFASGIQGALNLLVKVPDNWSFIDFSEGMSEQELTSKIDNLIKENSKEQIVFFTDLAGGTPYKVSSTCAFKNPNVEVVAGCNLASLLEIVFDTNSNAKECANKLVSISQKGIQLFDKQFSSNNNADSEMDGI